MGKTGGGVGTNGHGIKGVSVEEARKRAGMQDPQDDAASALSGGTSTDGMVVWNGSYDANGNWVTPSGDYGWAAELLTHLVRSDPGDTTARHAKAEALRQWGYLQKNMYWRTMAIGGANELDDTIDYSQTYEFQPPDVLNAIPAEKIVAGLRVRLDPDASANADVTVAWTFPDTGRSVAVQVRRGVAVVHDVAPDDVDATITIDAAAVRSLSSDIAAADDVLARATTVTDADVVRCFLAYFDPRSTTPVKLLAR